MMGIFFFFDKLLNFAPTPSIWLNINDQSMKRDN